MAASNSFTTSQNTLKLKTLTLFILLSSSLVSCVQHPRPFDRIFAFGDSFTDTGNTRTSTGPPLFNHVSNPPYGETYFHHPTKRYSDGRIIIDFIATALSLPFLPAYRDTKADRSHGINFAVGGATAIRHGFFVKNNITLNLVPESLQTELVWFNKFAESQGCRDVRTTPRECAAIMDDALVWLGEMGVSDYTSTTGSSIPRSRIQALAVRSTIGFLQALLNKGARYIVVQGLPMTGCVTYSFTFSSTESDRDQLGCIASINRQVYAHNAALESGIDGLRKQNPRATIVYFDYFDAHHNVFTNAPRYGFTERFRACCGYGGGAYNFDVSNTCGSHASSSCGNPSEYINWDGAHFTEAMYREIAGLLVNGSFCSPPFPYMVLKKIESG